MAIPFPYEYQSSFARRYVAGGQVRALLAVLGVRGVDVPDDVRKAIAACTELKQLDIWVRRAVTADKVADLFG